MVAPATADTLLFVHGAHSGLPAMLLKVPAGHRLQLLAPAVLVWPAAQGLQAVLEVVSLKNPEVHAPQVCEPGSYPNPPMHSVGSGKYS